MELATGGNLEERGRPGGPAAVLHTESPSDAALDVASSHALLARVAEGAGEALRVWIPPPALSFGRLDLLLPGAERAIALAAQRGLAPVRRLAGGRAAAIGPGTVCLGWAVPSRDMTGMQERYATLSEVLTEALGRLRVPVRSGELPGEWCPGAWSLLAGETKIGGLAQRVIRGGAWVEAVLVVSDAPALADRLDAVLGALELPWDRRTFGGLADRRPGLQPVDVAEALVAVLRARRVGLREAALPPEVRDRAAGLRAEHALGG